MLHDEFLMARIAQVTSLYTDGLIQIQRTVSPFPSHCPFVTKFPGMAQTVLLPPLQVEIWSLDTKWDMGVQNHLLAFTREKLCEVMIPRTGIMTPKEVMRWILHEMRPALRLVSCHDTNNKELASDMPLFPEVKTVRLATRWSLKMETEIKHGANRLMIFAAEDATNMYEARLAEKHARKSLEAQLRGEIRDIREELAQKRERLKSAQQRVKELEQLLTRARAALEQMTLLSCPDILKCMQSRPRSPALADIVPKFCADESQVAETLWETLSEPWG
jgi:hypothetical protein